MITYLAPLPAGNAVRCLFSPPLGADEWVFLRKTALPFTGYNDPDGVVVYDGPERAFVDATSLQNGTQVFYQGFYHVGGVWLTDSTPVSVTPAAAEGVLGPDPQEFIRDRLEWGLKAEVDANRLKHVDGAIPTLSAPPIFEETQFPIVTVHLAGQSMFARGVGELVAPDAFDEVDAEWLDNEGTLDTFRLTIVCWVVGNPDTRIALRKAVNRILRGNLPVMADKGIILPEWSAVDAEDFESYGAPVYQTIFTFTCVAPVAVEATTPPISDVTVTATEAAAAEAGFRIDIAA